MARGNPNAGALDGGYKTKCLEVVGVTPDEDRDTMPPFDRQGRIAKRLIGAESESRSKLILNVCSPRVKGLSIESGVRFQPLVS